MLPIALTIDRNYTPHAAVMLCSLFENHSRGCFIVYALVEVGVPPGEIQQLARFVEGYGHRLHLRMIRPADWPAFPLSRYATAAVYYRLFIPSLIEETLDKLLYLDCDLLVRANLSSLWQVPLGDNYVAAVMEQPGKPWYKPFKRNTHPSYFNSGVMLMNLRKWRNDHLTDRLVQYILAHPHSLPHWDQDALNAVIPQAWTPLDPQWNVTTGYFSLPTKHAALLRNPGIVHFTGPVKPWHPNCRHPYQREYFQYRAKTPWSDFVLPEKTAWHRYKQMIKKSINQVTGKKLFIVHE